jgi:hypothetical protein
LPNSFCAKTTGEGVNAAERDDVPEDRDHPDGPAILVLMARVLQEMKDPALG